MSTKDVLTILLLSPIVAGLWAVGRIVAIRWYLNRRSEEDHGQEKD